ncbi:proline racemase family protein [Pseudomonas sp. NPDC089752]|uniref:proline racemase family protein n=1 Tax=Pseudomonas sp. NPDC089752 TaxID=3364472 RepID=UPI00380B2ED2
MSFKRTIHAVDTHAGTSMRVITGGIPHIPGDSVHAKMKWLEADDDPLRKLMLREPRDYPAHCCNIIVPPSHPEADASASSTTTPFPAPAAIGCPSPRKPLRLSTSSSTVAQRVGTKVAFRRCIETHGYIGNTKQKSGKRLH